MSEEKELEVNSEQVVEEQPQPIKKKRGRPTREEAARKALSKPGRRKGSKNKSSEIKEDEATRKILTNMAQAINTLAALSQAATSETVRSNCAKWIVEFGLAIYDKTNNPKKPKGIVGNDNNQPITEETKTEPKGKVFPFAVK